MAIVIVVLIAALTASVMVNVYLRNELLDERTRTYEDEMWIDPIGWEETK